MQDTEQTKEQLLHEVAILRQQIAALEAGEAGCKQTEGPQGSDGWYRALVEQSLAGIYVIQDGRYRYVNPKFAEIFGYTPDEITTQCHHGQELIALEDRELVRNNVRKRLQGEVDSLRYTFRGQRKDGTRIDVEVYGTAMAFHGKPAVIGTLLDITERKQAEEALRTSEATLQSIFDSSAQSLILIDPAYRIRTFNKQASERAKTMCNKDMHHGDSIYDFVSYVDDFDRHFAMAFARQTVKVERRFPGTDNWIEATYSPVCTDDGRIIGVCLSIVDITERVQVAKRLRESEEQLRRTQKMQAIGTLAGGIAHDFNNILTAILGYTELALGGIPHESTSWRNLQEVLTAGKRAKALVQQILTFSRQTEQERKPVRLHLLVKEVLALLRPSLPTTITIQQHISEHVGTVLADPTQLHQVLINLCTNAEHAMRATGGILEVHLDAVEVDGALAAQHPDLHPGPYVRLVIRDTGHGMDTKVLERIFEPFFTTKNVDEGMGMGLAVAHGIVTSHNGAMRVQSTPGKGTTFTLYLPRFDEAGDNEVHTLDHVPHGTGRILVVDDEKALVHLVQETIERLGYDVVVSTDSIEALGIFRAMPQHFDLVMTDQTMPNMSGEVLAKELRRIRPDIPIILCTGFSYVMNAEKAWAMDIDAFLMKPLAAHDLGTTISQVLAQRSQQGT